MTLQINNNLQYDTSLQSVQPNHLDYVSSLPPIREWSSSITEPPVAGTLMVLACRLSTRSAGVSYSLVPSSWLQLCTIHLQASSKRQLRNSTGNRITDRVVVTRIHAQCKHTHTGTHSVPKHEQISPRCVQQQNNPDDTINPPCSATNLFHYHYALLVGSNLMTSQ